MNYRFGLKKLPERARAEAYLKSRFGLKPIKEKEEIIEVPEIPEVPETVCTFYPGTISINNPVDGYVWRAASVVGGESFSSIRTYHSIYTYKDYEEASFDCSLEALDTNPDKWYLLSRSIILFDTSALINAAIKSAQLSLRVNDIPDKSSNFTDDEAAVCLVGSDPANQDQLIKQDWSTFGIELFVEPIPYDEYLEKYQNSEPVVFQLNNAGLAAINKEGITKLGLMLKCDFLNQAPTWQNNSVISVDFHSRNSPDEDRWPQLIITIEGDFKCPEVPEV